VRVYAPLTLPGVGSVHASRYLADWPARAAYRRKLRLRVRTEEAALMAGYIVSGVVALAVTLYLFIALLFPERF
jgi:K+-transporting ATPase KdpF subunit